MTAEFAYQIDGVQYEGHQDWQVSGIAGLADLEKQQLKSEFAVNSNVPVYYDPENPDDAFLVVRELTTRLKNVWYAGVTPLAFGIFFLSPSIMNRMTRNAHRGEDPNLTP